MSALRLSRYSHYTCLILRDDSAELGVAIFATSQVSPRDLVGLITRELFREQFSNFSAVIYHSFCATFTNTTFFQYFSIHKFFGIGHAPAVKIPLIWSALFLPSPSNKRVPGVAAFFSA